MTCDVQTAMRRSIRGCFAQLPQRVDQEGLHALIATICSMGKDTKSFARKVQLCAIARTTKHITCTHDKHMLASACHTLSVPTRIDRTPSVTSHLAVNYYTA